MTFDEYVQAVIPEDKQSKPIEPVTVTEKQDFSWLNEKPKKIIIIESKPTDSDWFRYVLEHHTN